MSVVTMMRPDVTRRDYSLVGLDTMLAEARGLASAEWYACPIPRKQLKELMQRSDGPALRDTAIWLTARDDCRRLPDSATRPRRPAGSHGL